MKGHQFDSWAGHMSGLQVQSPLGHIREATEYERQPIDVSLLNPCLPPSLSPSLVLSLKINFKKYFNKKELTNRPK